MVIQFIHKAKLFASLQILKWQNLLNVKLNLILKKKIDNEYLHKEILYKINVIHNSLNINGNLYQYYQISICKIYTLNHIILNTKFRLFHYKLMK